MRKATLLALTALALGVLPGGCKKSPPSGAGSHSYKDAQDCFALDVPPDWQQIHNFMGAKVAFLSPVEDQNFHANVNVVVMPAPKTSDMQQYLTAAQEALRKFNGYKEIQAKVVRHSCGAQSRLIEAEHSMMAMPVHMKQYGFIWAGKEYVVTASMPAATADKWMPQMDKILDSFVIW